jgi:hypothetical protein
MFLFLFLFVDFCSTEGVNEARVKVEYFRYRGFRGTDPGFRHFRGRGLVLGGLVYLAFNERAYQRRKSN